jgi:hypothetical protein
MAPKTDPIIERFFEDAASPSFPSGHICPTCGERHKWTSYVYAHWRDRLFHTCETCQCRVEIVAGGVDLVKPGTRPE